MPENVEKLLRAHQQRLRRCRRCRGMHPPVVTGSPVVSGVLLVGQAPGDREGRLGRPFAWTAGKTLFRWFEGIGLEEGRFRQRVYMSAVCRCFPGKNPGGGDRVPSPEEVENCMRWLDAEIELLQPSLIIPVGKLAIAQFMDVGKLSEIIGHVYELEENGRMIDVIPLPHPSGASTWHRTEPGVALLGAALRRIEKHPAWKALL